MIEDETHSIPMAVDSSDAAAKSLRQIIDVPKQDVGQHREIGLGSGSVPELESVPDPDYS